MEQNTRIFSNICIFILDFFSTYIYNVSINFGFYTILTDSYMAEITIKHFLWASFYFI